MPSQYPLRPFRISDSTEVCDRIKIINNIANEGGQYQTVRTLTKAVLEQANRRYVEFQNAAKSDPGIKEALDTQNCFARIIAMESLRMVQSLPYVPNPVGQDWMQSTDYTARYGGECKALTALLVCINRQLGLKSDPYWITQTGQKINHVTGTVELDGKPFWEDGSIRGAMLGESPYEAAPRLGAQHITNGAGQALGAGLHGNIKKGSYPFAWWGWKGLWNGWPGSWWCSVYPYLCAPYSTVIARPVAYGFYPLGPNYMPFRRLAIGTLAGT